MKLLIVTQKVDLNDNLLGFIHQWIEEFTRYCQSVVVICLEKGDYHLPSNVTVLSLGKETKEKSSPKIFRRISYLFNFYRAIWRERKNYDVVFVHMIPEYVILGGPLWKIWGKKVSLWYAHGHVPLTLKLAHLLVDIIFTSTRSGCRLKSNKIKVVGQGIDVEKFQIPNSKFQIKEGVFKIISVGRISPVKDYETLIRAVEILIKEGIGLRVEIIGSPAFPEQEKYLIELKRTVKDKGLDKVINFVGAVPNKEIANYLQSADLFVNMSQTGSLDKAILEAMACELPVLTCNEALLEVFGNYQERLIYPKEDYQELAKRIKLIINLTEEERKRIGQDLRGIVVKEHSLERLVKKIIPHLEDGS